MSVEFQSDVIDRLARIETRLEALVTPSEDHEMRIRAIETKQSRLTGAMGLLSFIWTGLVFYIIPRLYH